MKKQIRQGVYETNSSSTHSLTIMRSSMTDSEILHSLTEDIGVYDEYCAEQFTDEETRRYVLNTIEHKDGNENDIRILVMRDYGVRVSFLASRIIEMKRREFGRELPTSHAVQLARIVRESDEYRHLLDYVRRDKDMGVNDANLESMCSSDANHMWAEPDKTEWKSMDEFIRVVAETLSSKSCVVYGDIPYHLCGDIMIDNI